ncbi:GntR family transcriptional regulator [Breznakiella homolactica]|uniref:GntR family transcriptional regulator n=1 Tax=Breznakiella homolactica TaxID=2798577 RepID=A0A7T7XQR6_9SPIR|nr:GntR family transcriptional regulator [Breznakiella homolactica]QQO10734.1 GntR family transcriptional regulator [Breznakiella homolactica]
MLEKIDVPLPISDQVADTIRRGIISGELKVGQKISVNGICSMLNVSATPVKEAFKILQAEGLLITKARSGTTISDFARRSLEHTALIRAALEGSAAYIAAQTISENDLEKLEGVLIEGDKAIERGDLDALVALNTQFHKGIRDATKNSYLILLIERLVSFDYSFRRSALQTLEERRSGSRDHWAVFRHIRDRNPEEAERALKCHIRRSASDVVSGIQEETDNP